MRKQKELVNVDLTAKDIKPVIDYDGAIIADYYISSSSLEVYKKTKDGVEKCYSYLNKKGNKHWKCGYYKVRINGRLYNLHWLLARAFVPGYKLGLVVDHDDDDSTNNKIENLKWVTRGENTKKYWNSLSEEEKEEYKAKYSNALKKAHAEGKYDAHLKRLHNKD